ncbi:MAG: tetratricopeptide repeat protein [Bacteroidales bacterium]|nr:tetratricopeptide repeat protein [Bacteroidales bacterium]
MKTRVKYCLPVLAIALTLAQPAPAADGSARLSRSREFAAAKELFNNGMFQKARENFEDLDVAFPDVMTKGYAVLCGINLKSENYRAEMESYLSTYPYSILLPQMRYAYGLNLFDDGDYATAKEQFEQITEKDLPRRERLTYNFKKAYCCFECGDYRTARRLFTQVEASGSADYAAPSRYSLGYIAYYRHHFDTAYEWFEKAAKDPRFKEISAYYMLECRFMLKDYDYVIANGTEAMSIVPEDRKASLGRMISESYLVKGNTRMAKSFYDEYVLPIGEPQNRSDYFYAGSLLYAVGDYKGAVDNFEAMGDRSDSLGQIASYHMAHSYIELKNKVEAMDAFREASSLTYDPQIREDAYYNYGKLAFDLNEDSSVYSNYLKEYPNSGRGELIYSYMAMSALLHKDYAGAIEAYDNIDYLGSDMESNYVKANYLRANELVNASSWRAAVQPLKVVNYYADKKDRLNQLSRFWLAESYFQSDNIAEAKKLYTELYNASALYGREEYSLIQLGLAYCYYREGDFTNAVKWFDKYIEFGKVSYEETAMIRKADCYFLRNDYASAKAAYDKVLDKYYSPNDIYPYYHAGLCSGLLSDNASKIKYLSHVLDADPSSVYYSDALYELGVAYAAAKDNTQAKKCFDRLILEARDVNYVAKSYIELAMMARNSKDYDKALMYYKTVVEQMPLSEQADDALLAIESIYQSQNNPQGYFAYLDSIGKGTTKTAEQKEMMIFNAAEQVFLAGNYDKALSALADYEKQYPGGQATGKADYYIAECYRFLDQKEKACDFYSKVIDRADGGSYTELAVLNFAKLSYELQKYDDAYGAYKRLGDTAVIEINRFTALQGMMRSAYKAGRYAEAASAAESVMTDSRSDKDLITEAKYIDAKSLLMRSERKRALQIFTELAANPKTAEGAEAAYILIQDAFDRGDFETVENKVYDLADANSPQAYWLARSYIVLGDAFAEQEQYNNARTIFESILDGYTPSSADDDIISDVNMRIEAINRMSN